jgi:hypothetical protein
VKPSDFPTPPLDFNPVTKCTWAEYSDTPPEFIRSVRRRGRRYLGIKYERKAQAHLRDVYGDCYLPSQWVRYRGAADDRVRWCQPDGVLVDRSAMALTIVEIKYNHTEVAWWQMFKLYLPVLEKLFEGYGYEFRCVEVCKWFDPAVRCPQKPKLRDRLENVQKDEFAVHIWS